MKRIWVYIIGVILLLVTAGSVFLAYSVIVMPASGRAGTGTVPVAEDMTGSIAEPDSADAEKKVQLLARETSYVEKATGIEFPGQIGVFVKTRVRENLNPLYGVTISYQTPDFPCADIYVYSLDPEAGPVDENAFKKECEHTHNNILGMKRNASVIDSVRELSPSENYPSNTFAKWYEVSVKGETIHSHLLMLRYAGRVVKIRVSFPAEEDGDLNDALLFERTILDAFKESSEK